MSNQERSMSFANLGDNHPPTSLGLALSTGEHRSFSSEDGQEMRSGGDPKFCGKKQFPQILPQLLSSAIFGFFEGLGGVAVSCPPQKS